MDFWEKFTTDPDGKNNRNASPMGRAVLGIVLLIIDVSTMVTGKIKLSKSNPTYIHFSDHRGTFILAYIVLTVGAYWAFSNAHKRYLMHDE